jgi:hypothetical protein
MDYPSNPNRRLYTAAIVLHNGKAYLPTISLTSDRIYLYSEPVYVVDAHSDALVDALEFIIGVGHPPIHDRTENELREAGAVLPDAVYGEGSKQLAAEALQYDIQWTKAVLINPIRVWLPRKHPGEMRKLEQMQCFHKDTTLRTLVEFILTDAANRAAQADNSFSLAD